jgi:proteasome lid subunit RPN8/RPN11
MDVITHHVNSAWARRVGGILVGRPRNSSVTIQAALPATQVEEHRGEIAFPPQVWEQTYDTLIERYPGSRIVGWYHSHPGTGPALSEYDRRLHSVLFSEAPSVALVLDPISQRSAWYGWVLGRLAPADGGAGGGFVGRPRQPARAALAAAVALGLAAGAGAGYWIGHERAAPASTSTVSAELRARLEGEREGALQLRRRLAAAEAALLESNAREAALRAKLEAERRRLREARGSGTSEVVVLRYHVQPGDTLWGLSERFYGKGVEWKRILRANGERLADPDVLHVGQTLVVPLP